MSARQLVRIPEGASQLLSDCSATPATETEFEELATRSLSNRCKNESTRERVCAVVPSILLSLRYAGRVRSPLWECIRACCG